jgi:hypothetical protein
MAYTAEELKRQLEEDENRQKDSLQAKRDALAADRAAEQVERESEQKKARDEILATIDDYKSIVAGYKKLPKDTHIFTINGYLQALCNGGKGIEQYENVWEIIPRSWEAILKVDMKLCLEFYEVTSAVRKKRWRREDRGHMIFGFVVIGVIIIGAIFLIRACVSVVSG